MSTSHLSKLAKFLENKVLSNKVFNKRWFLSPIFFTEFFCENSTHFQRRKMTFKVRILDGQAGCFGKSDGDYLVKKFPLDA